MMKNNPASKKSAEICTGLLAENPELLERWQRIENFDIAQNKKRSKFTATLTTMLKQDEKFSELALLEYRKFMLIKCLYPDQDFCASFFVETVWNTHLLYTQCYRDFCKNALACEFVHHDPAKGGSAEESQRMECYVETLLKYETVFGMPPPPEIWGSFEFQNALKSGYRALT